MKQETTRFPRWPTWLIVGLVVLFFVMCSGVAWVVEVPFYVVAGWVLYLSRTLPDMAWNWEAMASGVAFMVLSVAGLHFVARSIARSRDAAWPWKRSVCISTLMLLMFGVSLAIGGIMHEAAWLARTDRWLAFGQSYPSITRQISNARQLIIAVRLYAADESGTFPARLEHLLTAGALEGLAEFERLNTFTGDTNEPPAPWIYVRGLRDAAPEGLPIIIAPFSYKNGRRIVGTNDTAVELMKPSDIREALPKWREGYAELGIPLPPVLEEYDVPASAE